MPESTQPTEQQVCQVTMSDDSPCGRPVYTAPPSVDHDPVCLMHSRDPNKDQSQFHEEIRAILQGTSAYLRPTHNYDFRRFNFVRFHLGKFTFTKRADFTGATFTEIVSFDKITFAQDADFTGATFPELTMFWQVTFSQNVNFTKATFTGIEAQFRGVKFTGEVDFTRTVFF